MKAVEAALEKGRLSPVPQAMALSGLTMEALVYHGPGQRAWEKRPRPEVRDATERALKVILHRA